MISRRTMVLLALLVLLSFAGYRAFARQQARCAALSHPAGRRAAIGGASASPADLACITNYGAMPARDLAVAIAWLVSGLAVARSVAIDVEQGRRQAKRLRETGETGDTEADSLRE